MLVGLLPLWREGWSSPPSLIRREGGSSSSRSHDCHCFCSVNGYFWILLIPTLNGRGSLDLCCGILARAIPQQKGKRVARLLNQREAGRYSSSTICVIASNPNMATDEFSLYSAEECLRKGLRYLKYSSKEIGRVCERTNLERFSSHYSFSPASIAAVLNDNPDIDPKKMFLTLYWWKSYQTEHQMESRWKMHPETIRNACQLVCRQLAARKKDKIVFADFDPQQVYLATIDCVHFECQEFGTDPDSKWYSHKHNGPGLSYEVCVDTVKERIIWAEGPYPAATHDITIFRGGKVKEGSANWKKSSLWHKMPAGKRLVGDSGYVGEPDKISTSLGGHSAKAKELFARFKSRQETLFRGYKALGIFSGAFRHNGKQGGGAEGKMAMHKLVFDAVTVVQQYALETDRPLFTL